MHATRPWSAAERITACTTFAACLLLMSSWHRPPVFPQLPHAVVPPPSPLLSPPTIPPLDNTESKPHPPMLNVLSTGNHTSAARLERFAGPGAYYAPIEIGAAGRSLAEVNVAPPRHNPACAHQCNFIKVAPLHSAARDVTYVLSARQCAASTTSWGVRPRRGIDLSTIVVLGGSVSCNRNVGNRTDADASAEPQAPDAPLAESGWPQQLAAILRRCGGEQSVEIVNLCKGSTGTDYWLNRLRFDRAIRDATVVIVETANNDPDHEQTEVLTEVMVRRLLELPRRPFLLWLAASFNREWHTSAELRQLKIVREYGVGQVSVLNALRPSHDAASQAFIGDIYFQDGIHPSKLGHRLLASITAAHIMQQQKPNNELVASAGRHATELIPSASDVHVSSPFFVHPAARALLKQQQRPPRLVADLADRALCAHGGNARTAPDLLTEWHSHGFAFAEDVPGKCGLIATRPGSRVVFRLPADTTGVLVGFLSSYAHNGLMRVTLRQQRHGCEEQQSNATSSALVLDTLSSTTERRVSVYSERYVQGALPAGVKTDCSWLELRVLKAKDRDEHKIKLLQLVAD